MNELNEMLCILFCHKIISGVLDARDVLLKHTNQWVQNIDEQKIEGTIELAWKVSWFLEKMGNATRDVHSMVEMGESPSEVIEVNAW